MFLRIDANRVINTEHIISADWEAKENVSQGKLRKLTIILSTKQSVTLAHEDAQKVWDYLCSKAESLEKPLAAAGLSLGKAQAAPIS
jgi:hypothetical protein